MLFFYYAKIKYCKSGDLHTYVVPVCNCFVTGHMPGFFILGRKIMEDKEKENRHRDIKRTKADIYESLYNEE